MFRQHIEYAGHSGKPVFTSYGADLDSTVCLASSSMGHIYMPGEHSTWIKLWVNVYCIVDTVATAVKTLP